MSEILHLLAGCLKRGEAVVLATIVKASGSVPRRAGSKMLIFADGRIAGTIGGGEMESRIVSIAPAVLAVGKPRVVPYSLVDAMRGDPGICGGEVEVYLEPYLPAATVWVIGCGHVGQAMVRQAKLLGYYVVAWDDREGLASAETLPQADLHLTGTIESAISAHP
ncbi:MAG: hypothetical protein KAG66_07680, partial [Methylococcales bacterium]|nr:hypothetical protein [Methylococcales bacterium]